MTDRVLEAGNMEVLGTITCCPQKGGLEARVPVVAPCVGPGLLAVVLAGGTLRSPQIVKMKRVCAAGPLWCSLLYIAECHFMCNVLARL